MALTPVMKFITTSTMSLWALATYAVAADQAFDQTLTQQGIAFHIQCPNHGSTNQLTITPKGLKGDNKPLTVEVDGSVTGAEVGDLNIDGFPEVYVYVQGAGSGSHGTLVAYASNKNKSLSSITLPELTDDKVHAKGYMGHDQFAVVENTLCRRFPIYKAGDTNSKPTGKTRQLQYKLKAGEAGWLLKLDKAVEF